jgi:hypothetical protein
LSALHAKTLWLGNSNILHRLLELGAADELSAD